MFRWLWLCRRVKDENMSGFSGFVISFCTGCVILGFLFVLCPKGNMYISVKYAFCLCFVCCVVGGIVSIKQPDFSDFEKSNTQEILTEQNAAVTAQMVFGETLRQENINFRKITVNTNKLTNGSIIIDSVTVFTNEDASKILQLIDSDNYEVIVVNE